MTLFKKYIAKNLVLLCFCGAMNVAIGQTKLVQPSIASFFKSSQFSSVKFSPDGKNIGLLSNGENEKQVLVIMDSIELKPKIVAGFNKVDVVRFSWVNNNRLVYSIGDRLLAGGEVTRGNGLFAINKDGTESRQLIDTSASIANGASKFRILGANHSFASVSNLENSSDVYVYRRSGSRINQSITLIKLNTFTGLTTEVTAPSNMASLMMDQSGQPRIATTIENKITSILYKDTKTQQWRKLIEFDPLKEGGFSPEFIAPDGQLYVNAHNGRDHSAIYRYDLEKNRLDDAPIVDSPGFDFEGSFIFSKAQGKLLGIRYESDASGTVWLDEKMEKIQGKVDSLLSNTVNFLSIPEDQDATQVLVYSFSDVHPGSVMLYSIASGKFTPIGNVLPEIDSNQMSHKDFVRIKVRDGMEIPAYLTLPKNSTGKNLPMVVMVHGGPYVRGGHWNWNPQTQFLASRGYAVLEPDFRGSMGYGQKLHTAGWKQWGLSMQDDITDATKWAIEKGYAHPDRICIAGASYGGYATLMGLIKEPNLYRCGISWVGVTDINLLYSVAWSDQAGTSWQRYGMPVLIGDQEKDADQLKATSPVEQAHRLTRPLILAYGAADVRVPLVHGERFLKAVPKDAKVEWIVYPEEAHGWRKLENNIDFWGRVEKFLEEHTAIKQN